MQTSYLRLCRQSHKSRRVLIRSSVCPVEPTKRSTVSTCERSVQEPPVTTCSYRLWLGSHGLECSSVQPLWLCVMGSSAMIASRTGTSPGCYLRTSLSWTAMPMRYQCAGQNRSSMTGRALENTFKHMLSRGRRTPRCLRWHRHSQQME
jgi:hypothetical protein